MPGIPGTPVGPVDVSETAPAGPGDPLCCVGRSGAADGALVEVPTASLDDEMSEAHAEPWRCTCVCPRAPVDDNGEMYLVTGNLFKL